MFHPDELTRGVSGAELGLDFLSCRRIELDTPARVTIETRGEETLLVCIGGQAEFVYNDTRGVVNFKDFCTYCGKAQSSCKRITTRW